MSAGARYNGVGGFEVVKEMVGKFTFVTAKLLGKEDCRQGWLMSLRPLRIKGESGKVYLCEGTPKRVINPPPN